MSHKILYVSAALAASVAASAHAAPVNQVSYASLTGTQLVTFDDLAGGSAPGTNYDSIVTSNGVGLGEHFVGQTVGVSGSFDTLSGSPTGPLTLAVGTPGHNLNIFSFSTNVLTGLGPAGFPSFDAIGEGAFAVQFSSDQSEFGFQLVGGDGGTAFVSFFNAAGGLIDSISLSSLANADYGFSRDGGVKDIRGISISNNDLGGIGFDNLKFDVKSIFVPRVPETSTWAMMLLGFGAVGYAMRRRQVGFGSMRTAAA
jgi:hypothetical protein